MAKPIKLNDLKTGLAVIFDFLAGRRREALLILVLGMASALGNGAVPYITGRLFDSILTPGHAVIIFGRAVPGYALLLLTLAGIQLLVLSIEYRATILRSIISFHSRFDYQSKSYAKLLDLPMSFHKQRKIGEINSKISNAGMGMEVITDRALGGLGPQFLAIFVAIGFLVSINPILALVAASTVATYVGIAFFFIRDSADLQKKIIKGWGKAFGDIHDVVGNTQTVKQAVTEEREKKKIIFRFKNNIFPYWFGIDKIWQTLDSIRGLVVITLQLIVFVWSIRLVLAGQMTIGQLIAFNSYLAMLFAPFTSLLQMWRMIQSAILDIAAVEKILALPSEIYEPNSAETLPAIKGEIEFQNVSFRYEASKPILEDISFKIAAGQTVALVGESGAGKSTLIDLLSGYYFPKKGRVLIDGRNLRQLPLKQLRAKIAVVPQEVVLFNDTIKNNIRYGNFKASGKLIKEAARQAHALDFIEKFPRQWQQAVGERGVKLSVGQKQRVAIARAILRDPRILILDEPTSALDANSEQIIQASLVKLMTGRTTFIVAHRLSTVRHADLILVFENGRIVERGRHADLLLIPNGKYRHLYELQVGLHK